MDVDVKSLHPLEVKTLRHVKPGEEITADRLVKELSFKIGQCNQAFSWLAAKKLLVEARRTQRVVYELTELGNSFAKDGSPEERILSLVEKEGPMKMTALSEKLGLENRDIGSAFGQLSKEGVLAMDGEKQVSSTGAGLSSRMKAVRNLLEKAVKNGQLEHDGLVPEEQEAIAKISKKRGASGVPFKASDREDVVYTLSPDGDSVRSTLIQAGVTGEEIGALTPEMLSQGSWKGKAFREYNINSPANRVLLGRRNPYGEYLHWVKDKLTSLGFEEFDGPLVETEFWNGDALFMPQFHSARDIHDVYYVKNPSHAREIEQPYLDQVAAAHENGWKTGSRGWGYSFDRDFTRRQILRSQGTVLSAKQLPKAKVPGKYFGVVRCFRYDQVDATHGADFYQTEGIVLGEDVNLRTLLGLLKMFAEEIAGAEEVKYVPGYFPFTEPSIEVHIKHPELGWFELGGSGIFRPEVSQSLGIDVPVLAWGLGIDRMALMHLGLNDLRELFSSDIENVRLRRNQ